MRKIIGILMVVCFVVGCANPFFPEKKEKWSETETVTDQELQELVDEVTDGVTVSTDGSNVGRGDWWVTQEALDALEAAIRKAEEAIAKGEKSLDEIYAELQEAIEAFERAKQRGRKPATKEELQELVDEAKDVTDGVETSTDGSDVSEDDWWVTKEDWDALEDAIKNAEDAIKEDEINLDDIFDELDQAINEFERAKKRGTKPAANPVTIEELEELFDTAEEAKDGVVVSKAGDGSDVNPDDWWVTQEEWEALEDAIQKAEDYIEEGEKTLDEIYDELQDALKDFEDAKKPHPCVDGHDHFESLVCKRTGCDHQYALGDIGPGGGVIFYVADGGSETTPIAHTRPNGFTFYISATDTTGIKAHYLEAAPANALGGEVDTDGNGTNERMIWRVGYTSYTGEEVTGLVNIPYTGKGSIGEGRDAPDATQMGLINDDIGMGRKNTGLIVAFYGTTQTTYLYAARAANNYTGGTADDWFLPSIGELYWLYQNRGQLNDQDGIAPMTPMTEQWFWSSSQDTGNGIAWAQGFHSGYRGDDIKQDFYYVRAVRAF